MKKLLFLLTFILFSIFLKPLSASAEVIHSFDVDILANKEGLMFITETINYDFEYSQRHGIFRDIPMYSKVGEWYRIVKINDIKVKRDGEDEKFSNSQTNEELSLKIGDADKTITGNHVYTISYTVENGIGSNFPDHDEIYWNATGNGWDVSIEKATISISNDFNIKQTNFLCFTGEVGSRESSCEISDNSSVTKEILYPGNGLTVVAVYPVDSFPKSILSKSPPRTFFQQFFEFIFSNYLLIWALLNLVLAPSLFYWYQKHKNKKRFGKPAVNFDIPKDENGEIIRPALSGTIDTARLERDDVVATIFDLAIRKYIRLEETKTNSKVLGIIDTSKKEQTIKKLKEGDGKLNPYEKKLFDRFFEAGDSVSVSSLRLDFYKTFSEMEKDVFKALVEKKYYTKNPMAQQAGLFILGGISLISFNLILAGMFFYLSRKLNGRTALGDEMDYKIDGLKLFLKSMDRNYKWQAEKFYVVEQMIPYAMALGYIDKFMEQLKIIKPDYNPSWYKGYSGSFYVGYVGFYSAATTNMTSSSSSGSSGGFSGGGGGGGGGGSW